MILDSGVSKPLEYGITLYIKSQDLNSFSFFPLSPPDSC